MSIRELISTGRTASKGVGAKRKYEWSYRAVCDLADTEYDVLVSDSIPRLYAQHPSDRRAVVKDVNVNRMADGTGEDASIYEIRVSFDTDPVSERNSQADNEENPLDRPAEISWDYLTQPFVITKTVDDPPLPIENTAGTPYDPGIEVEETIVVLHITRNEANFSASTALAYGNTVNSSTFYGAAAGKAKILPPRAQRVVENDMTYWRVSYEVHFRELGWKVISVNRGLEYLKTANDKSTRTAVIGKDGQTATEPVKLKEDGTLWTSGTVFYNEFKVYLSKNFGALNLE